jgi:septin family protein
MTVPHVGDWRLPSPACFAVIGQSSTGKSTLIAKLIEDASVWQKRPNNVVYSGPVVKRTSKYIEDLEANCARQGMRFIYHEDFAECESCAEFGGGKSARHSHLGRCSSME